MPPEQQDNQQQQPQASTQLSEVVKTLNEANNILVTVSSNPSVDQLAACIGLTVALNKKDKHATAVFSGNIPSTIEFLEPDKTLEKNTDSLRDFIISLDKSKADKLRYKVENDVVKIFITPYKTSISEKDLDFSQGDFNVDAIVALGVQKKEDLDNAITAHGRILHDAKIISVNVSEGSELGTINWQETEASSLSEMSADIVLNIDQNILDSQIATALLTGVVAETERFRNEKSKPHTMTVAGKLMSAGASTQLVSSKLEEPKKEEPKKPEVDSGMMPVESQAESKTDSDGTMHIEHGDNIHIDDSGELKKLSEIEKEVKAENGGDVPGATLPEPQSSSETEQESPKAENFGRVSGPSIMTEPPKFGGELTANARKVDQDYVKAPDPLAEPDHGASPQFGGINSVLTHSNEPSDDQTLSQLEQSVNSPHINQPNPPLSPQENVSPPLPQTDARDAVNRAVQGSADYGNEPIQALGSTPLGNPIDHQPANGLPPDNNQSQAGGPPPPPVPPPLA